MNIHKIEEVLKQIEENKNYKDFTKLLSYEKRKKLLQLLTEREEVNTLDDNLLINYFTEEEATDIYNNEFYKLNADFKYVLMCNLNLRQVKEIFEDHTINNVPEKVIRSILIKLSSDEEKIEFVEKYFKNLSNYEEIKVHVFASLKDDNLKLKYLDIITDDNLKLQYLDRISDDNLKLKYIGSIIGDNYKSYVLEGLKDDNLKLQYLDIITDDNYKADILLSLKDDNLKLQSMNKIIDDYAKATVLASLKDDNLKLKYLDIITDDNYKAYVFVSLKDDNLKLQHLDIITDDNYKSYVLASLKDDNLKLQYLGAIADDNYKAYVLERLKDDNLKLQYLDAIIDDYAKAIVLESLKDDNLKLQYLDAITDNNYKAYVLASLKNDNLKLQYMDTITDDNLKLQYLRYPGIFSDNYYKVHVLISLKDDNLKLQHLDSVTYDNYKVNVFLSLKDDNLKLQHLDKIKGDYHKAIVLTKLKDDNLKLHHIDKITNQDNKIMVIESIKNLKIRLDALLFLDDLTSYCIEADWLNKLENINDDIHKEIIKKIAQENNLNYDNLLKLFLKFGYNIKYASDNLEKIVNLKPNEFEKIIQIIDVWENSKLTMTDVNSVIITLYEREFRLKNRKVILTFPILKDLIKNKDKEKILNIFSEINKNIDINDILKKYNLNFEIFINGLLENEDNKFLIDVLHEITGKYLDRMRALYVSERSKSATSELNLDYDYDKKYLISNLFQKYDVKYIYDFIKKGINDKLLDDNEIELLNNDLLFIECLKFKKGNEDYSKDEFPKIKVKLRALNGILNKLYEEKKLDFLGDKEAGNIIFKPKETISSDFIKLINELDIDMLNDKLFSNPKLYNKLINILKKHKFMNWSDTFEKLLESTDFNFKERDIAVLINYFYDFYPKLEEKQQQKNREVRLSDIFDEVKTYGSSSVKYNYLLGTEDSKLIISNPSPNSSGLKVDERLKKIPDEILIQYKRKYITVPPMNEDILLENGKKIHVDIGDTTSSINLTYGERTGSCMRIGGVGDSLFDFCLENENGFHIKFINPITGDFISRVSGFRNGNTVFLNQLRDSLDKNISNSDLISVVDIVARKIVELTKESNYPIKNVIISDGYVMEIRKNKNTILNCGDIKEGYYDFYSDVSCTNAIYLEENDEIKLGPEKAEKYDVLRKKIVCYENPKDVIDQIQKFNLINGLLKGKSLGDITLISEETIMNIEKIYVAEDFLLAYDYSGNIILKLILDREEYFKEKANFEINTLINILNENERGKTK